LPFHLSWFQEDDVEDDTDDDADDDGIPKLATRIVALDEKVVQISATNTWDWVDRNKSSDGSHTFILTESGRLYSLGAGSKGQLGVKLAEGHKTRPVPDRVDIDLA
jgi:alpha-tubulin suppressor-like RCC1 family protein